MSVAALDLGRRRIGIAALDAAGVAVHPLAVLKRCSLGRDIEAIAGHLGARGIKRVVVGLPLNMDGTEGPQARAVRRFAEALRAATGLVVELHDERLSTREAREQMAGLGRRRERPVDAVAAAIILESWLGAAGGGRRG